VDVWRSEVKALLSQGEASFMGANQRTLPSSCAEVETQESPNLAQTRFILGFFGWSYYLPNLYVHIIGTIVFNFNYYVDYLFHEASNTPESIK
jgi:hypothetical protein